MSTPATALDFAPPLEVAASSAAPARPSWIRRISWWTLLVRAVSLVAVVWLWHWLSTAKVHLGLVTFANVPSPAAVVAAAWDLLQSPKLGFHVGHSLVRIGVGFAAAAVVGIGLGLLIGRFRWAENTLQQPLEVLRPIPAVAWIPLAILMFPSSEASMIFINFTGAVFPILLNTIHGVESVDARLIASARSLGTRRWRLFTEVVLPSAGPSIITGLSIGMGTCWFCLVSAEMISGQFGIGYYTWESYTLQNYDGIIVGMLLIGLFGMGSSALVRYLGRLAMPWYRPGGRSA